MQAAKKAANTRSVRSHTLLFTSVISALSILGVSTKNQPTNDSSQHSWTISTIKIKTHGWPQNCNTSWGECLVHGYNAKGWMELLCQEDRKILYYYNIVKVSFYILWMPSWDRKYTFTENNRFVAAMYLFIFQIQPSTSASHQKQMFVFYVDYSLKSLSDHILKCSFDILAYQNY